LLDVSHLRGDGRDAAFVQNGLLSRQRTRVDTAPTSVVADAFVGDIGHPVVIDVMYDVDIHVVHGPVVSESVAVPIAAFVTMADVAEAVVDAAVEADVRGPIAVIPTIAAGRETPVGRGPESTDIRRKDPGTGYPIIAG
jgi:hypothetical protein